MKHGWSPQGGACVRCSARIRAVSDVGYFTRRGRMVCASCAKEQGDLQAAGVPERRLKGQWGAYPKQRSPIGRTCAGCRAVIERLAQFGRLTRRGHVLCKPCALANPDLGLLTQRFK